MVDSGQRRSRDLPRLVRSSMFLTDDALAAAAGVTPAALRSQLRRTKTRGGCARMLASAAAGGRVAASCAGLCPPPAARAAQTGVAIAAWGQPSTTLAGIEQTAHNPAAAAGQLRAGLAALIEIRYSLSPMPDTVASSIADNPNCPPALLVHLAAPPLGFQGSLTSDMAAYNPRCLPHTLARLTTSDSTAANTAARHCALPVSLLGPLSRNSDALLRASAADHPECPAEILETLAEDPEYPARCAAAANPRTPISALRRVASEHDNDVLSSLAANPNCPSELLETLAEDVDVGHVVAAAAANPNCPPAVLRELASSDDPQTRSTILANPACPVEVMSAAAADLTAAELAPAAANPNCPPDVLDRFVVSALKDRSGPGGDMGFDLFDAMRDAATNPGCSTATLTKIANDNNHRLRSDACTNPHCPPDVLTRMMSDPDHGVAAAARRAYRRATRPSPTHRASPNSDTAV